MCVAFQVDPLQFINDRWTALSRPIGYLLHPKRRICKLTDAMKKLRCKSKDRINKINSAKLAGKKPTNQIQNWLDRVDAIEKEVSKIEADYKNGSFRWGINYRAAHSLAVVSELDENYDFDDVAAALPPSRVQEIPAELPSATPTMDNYLSKLKAFLQDDESGIIGIWGMGGVGKTTLLRRLNEELLCSSECGQSSSMFDHVIWAVASKDYKLEKLQRDIAGRLGLPLCEDRVQQAIEIMNFLKDKSFLLFLDDLWKQVDLANLGIPPILRPGATKKKVVFTTRIEHVCAQMKARHKMKLECLNEEEAWQLFQEKVGEETLQERANISKLARQVAKECDGLPLALVVIGSAMSTKKTPKEWQDAINMLQKSRLYEIDGIDDMILRKLKFSYDNLANEIYRKCFLLCSLWPEDHSISKTDLIECWMGHGLVDERNFNNINEAYERGHSLIGALQASCLLESGDNKDREVKMHDLVRDLALWIASDCGKKSNGFIVLSSFIASDDTQSDVERISLVRSDLSDTSALPANCSKLETLMVQESNSFKSIVTGFFKGTRALTYLDLSYTAISELPQEIDLLGNLRYLNVSHTNIQSLPWRLGYLRELRFLLLRGLISIDIPHGVLEKLERLFVIDMTHTWCSNWRELSSRRGCLKGAGIVLESIDDLNELAKLQNVLTWRLELRKLMGFKEPLKLLSQLQLGSRSIRSSIQMLKIESCKSLEEISMEPEGRGGFQKWCLSKLEEMELRTLPELNKIVWSGVRPAEMLPNLTVLTIFGCHKLSNISWVTRLPSLEVLTVHSCGKMERIIVEDNKFAGGNEEENDAGTAGSAFLCLRRLCLRELGSLRVFGGSFPFPSLEVLQVIHCPNMKTLPFGEMAGKKLKEIRGERGWWENLVMTENMKTALLPYLKDKSLGADASQW